MSGPEDGKKYKAVVLWMRCGHYQRFRVRVDGEFDERKFRQAKCEPCKENSI